jgi:hypothetical protein
MSFVRLILSTIVSAAAVAGCHDGLAPRDVAGTYTLHSVNGTPVPLSGVNVLVSGAVTLTALGDAQRRVTYRVAADGTVREFVATGRFRVEGSVVELALTQDGFVWRPHATLQDGTLTLTYPHPADGPDIIEAYRRP